jgi:hypothetical protein
MSPDDVQKLYPDVKVVPKRSDEFSTYYGVKQEFRGNQAEFGFTFRESRLLSVQVGILPSEFKGKEKEVYAALKAYLIERHGQPDEESIQDDQELMMKTWTYEDGNIILSYTAKSGKLQVNYLRLEGYEE